MKTLFVMGAGASKDAGAPVMSTFLDEAERLHRIKHVGTYSARHDFESVFRAMDELQRLHAKSHIELGNIEHLFGVIEMGAMLGKLGSRSAEEIAALRDSLVTVILRTLEFTVNFPVSERHIYPGPPYFDFTQMLISGDGVTNISDRHDLAFITFNYDLALDYALYHQCLYSDYGLEGSVPSGRVPLLKLHGSMNWGKCSKCGDIVPYPIDTHGLDITDETEDVHFNVTSVLPALSHCGEAVGRVPVFVPPTWNKGAHHRQIVHVWRCAAEVLSSAENIFIIGYSMPDTDVFFRYLLAVGTLSDTRIHRFWVFDPDTEVERRFRDVVGGAVDRKFKFFAEPFSAAVPIIGEALAKA